MKDGVKEVIDPVTGKKKQVDKNGREILAEDAFREVVVEVVDDGDAAEQEVDPKTGKVVKKKQLFKTQVDPKTGKMVKITTKEV